MTERITIHPERFSKRHLDHIMNVIENGGLICYPTDTVYALGCAIDNRHGIERIYKIKQMDHKQRIAMICSSVSEAAQYGHITDSAYQLIRRILPGPYTIIVPPSRKVPKIFYDKKKRQIGIRTPDHPIPIAMAKDNPIATSSAILPESESPCSNADQAFDMFGKHIDLLIDGGDVPGQLSTVLQFNNDEIEILREGLNPSKDLLHIS